MIQGEKVVAYYTQEDIAASEHGSFRQFVADLMWTQNKCIILQFETLKYYVANDNVTLMCQGILGQNVTNRSDLIGQAADASKDAFDYRDLRR